MCISVEKSLTRRRYVAVLSMGMVGLAGCASSNEDSTATRTQTITEPAGTETATPTDTETPTVTQADEVQYGKLTPSDGAASARFGIVGLDGKNALIGAFGDEEFRGSAYLFEQEGSGWTETTKLTADDPGSNANVGNSVSLSGGTALVGARYDPAPNGVKRGAAYIFEQTDAGWQQSIKLRAADGEKRDQFGTDVAIDGDTAVVGARFADETGAVYVFRRDGGGWTQTAKLTPNQDTIELFGSSVDIMGDRIITGSISTTTDSTAPIVAYIFEWNGSEWVIASSVSAGSSDYDYAQAFPVAIDADTAIVGASYDPEVNGQESGAVYVFDRADGDWNQTTILAPEGGPRFARFGFDVELSGNSALIGAPFYRENESDEELTGAAYIFNHQSGSWAEQRLFVADDGADEDFFGGSVALSSERVLVGAIGDDTSNGEDSGSVYTFER